MPTDTLQAPRRRVLSAAQRVAIRRATRVRAPDPSETDDELNVVPFLDVVVNLIMFLLMSMGSVAFLAEVPARLPSYGEGPGEAGFQLVVTEAGFHLSGPEGLLAPDCASPAMGGPTVPRHAGRYDLGALRACAARAAGTAGGRITLSADPLVPFQTVVQAMDAVRVTPSGRPLFDDVALAAGVR
ncbi:MAG: hypothetical protein AAGH15_00900 [Myxococcota bacterium]